MQLCSRRRAAWADMVLVDRVGVARPLRAAAARASSLPPRDRPRPPPPCEAQTPPPAHAAIGPLGRRLAAQLASMATRRRQQEALGTSHPPCHVATVPMPSQSIRSHASSRHRRRRRSSSSSRQRAAGLERAVIEREQRRTCPSSSSSSSSGSSANRPLRLQSPRRRRRQRPLPRGRRCPSQPTMPTPPSPLCIPSLRKAPTRSVPLTCSLEATLPRPPRCASPSACTRRHRSMARRPRSIASRCWCAQVWRLRWRVRSWVLAVGCSRRGRAAWRIWP